MTTFNIYTKETATADSTELLAKAEKSYGFIPNLLGVLAESPTTLNAYLALGQIFEESSFSPTERQVVLLTINRLNDCRYCVAAHSAIAEMQKLPADMVEAIRNDRPIADSKLEALRTFTASVFENRAWVPEAETAAFLEAGFNKAQILEVILGIGFKTISNYANHFASTPLDAAFAAKVWVPAGE